MKKLFLVVAILAVAGAVQAAQQYRVSFVWDANTESDLAGYRLFEGTTRVAEILKPAVTYSYIITGSNPRTWTLTAYDTAGNESGPSAPVTWDMAPACATGLSVVVTPIP